MPHVLCGLMLVLYALQLLLHASSISATTDEPLHLLAGHRYLQCGDFAFNPEHPPLLKELAALPLQGMEMRMPEGLPCNPGFIPKAEAFRLGAVFLAENGEQRILLPARMMSMLPAIVLALLTWVAAWRMFGAWPAVGVMALFATEPVLVAHGSLVTTDMAITTALFLSVLVLHASRHWSAPVRVLAMGVSFGLMLASKHSALLLLPVLAVLRLLDVSLFREGRAWRAWPHLLRPSLELCVAGGIAIAILWSFYGFRYSATPGAASTVAMADFVQGLAKSRAGSSSLSALMPLIEATRLFPEAYQMGLADIVQTSVRYTRVLGQMYPEGQWFFYPVAFSVKSSVLLLLLLPVGLVAICRDTGYRRAALFLILPASAYLAIAMSSKFSDGIRHILQVYPYFLMLAGFGLATLWRRGRWWALALSCLLAWQGIVVARTAPDYIPFANAFWGGPARAHDALTFDSVEWGQSLRRIRTYVARNGISECWIAGVDDPMLFASMAPCKRLPEGRYWRMRKGGVEAVPRRIGGTIFLGMRAAAVREGQTYRPLLARRQELLAGAVLVFHGGADLPGAAALSHAIAADAHLDARRVDDALRDGQAAVALYPADPRTWISQGDALLAAGRVDEARHSLRRAEQALAADPDYGFFADVRLADLRERLGQQK